MTAVTAPVTKQKPAIKKLRRLQVKHFEELVQAITVIESASSAVRRLANEYREDADMQMQVMQERMDRHTGRKDVRAPVRFKPHPNKRWTVSFGDEVYELGPLPDFADIDDDEPHYYWAGPDGKRHPSTSLFQALVGIVQEYHNAAHMADTGPVSTPDMAQPAR